MTDTAVIYETGTAPAPKARYRIEILTRDGDWADLEDNPTRDLAIAFADYHARTRRTKARVIDTELAAVQS